MDSQHQSRWQHEPQSADQLQCCIRGPRKPHLHLPPPQQQRPPAQVHPPTAACPLLRRALAWRCAHGSSAAAGSRPEGPRAGGPPAGRQERSMDDVNVNVTMSKEAHVREKEASQVGSRQQAAFQSNETRPCSQQQQQQPNRSIASRPHVPAAAPPERRPPAGATAAAGWHTGEPGRLPRLQLHWPGFRQPHAAWEECCRRSAPLPAPPPEVRWEECPRRHLRPAPAASPRPPGCGAATGGAGRASQGAQRRQAARPALPQQAPAQPKERPLP